MMVMPTPILATESSATLRTIAPMRPLGLDLPAARGAYPGPPRLLDRPVDIRV
jgi:hypothetical protein